ncbi:DUF2339 domain-containing protein [Evansella sp. AB-rgal1]|uniref:DUF2339 domain-containing protein n=1 Tax=Evansella sp. AB-rgal1 TaxID=3242696 RepID=UPI00359D54FF
MDEFKQRLQQIQESQEKLAKESESVLREYESHDFLKENQELLLNNEEMKKRIMDLQKRQQKMEKDNQELRHNLQEQILDEKLSILKVTNEKLTAYFGNQVGAQTNRLSYFEAETKRKMKSLIHETNKLLEADRKQFLHNIQEMSRQLQDKIAEHQELLAKKEKELLQHSTNRFDSFAEEEITEEVMKKRMKQNQMEIKIGLNWINKIGILLIILGVGAAFRYSYANWFNDYFKGGIFFALGLLMLAGGEWFYRKEKRTFALGILGGGIGVLYGSIFFSYFLLEIIELLPALLLSVVVTATAVVLSLRYESKTICSFGLVGGYLPFYSYLFAFGLEDSAVYAAMGYLLILSLSILWISFQKQWSIVHYISFLFNIPSMIILILLSSSDLVSMGYSIATFTLYLAITLGYSFKHKVSLKAVDTMLLGFNTFISCIILYSLFNSLNWDHLRGLLAVIFSILYVGLGRFVQIVMPKEKQAMVLFYGTALTFAVLTIPFQFDLEYLALGWLVEAIVLMVYANRKKLKALEKAGWLILSLCLGAFFIEVYGNVIGMWYLSSNFNFKYFSITLGVMIVASFYTWLLKNKGAVDIPFYRINAIHYFKYLALGNLWIYIVYEARFLYEKWVPYSFGLYGFYEMMMISFLTIGLAYILTKITLFYDKIVKYYCLLLYGIGTFIGLAVTMFIPTLQYTLSENTMIDYLSLGLLISFHVLVFFSGRDLLLAFIKQQYKNLELYPLILAVYLLGVIAAFLTVQLHLGDVGFVFSSVFLVVAIGYILYGFQRQYVYIRRLGLGLTLLSTGKLILFDLSFLSESSKILAYFCFGIALVGISYVYQKLSSSQSGGRHRKEDTSM